MNINNEYGETPYPGPFGPSTFSNTNPESFTKMIEAHLKAFPNSSVWVPNWNDPDYLKQMETSLNNIENYKKQETMCVVSMIGQHFDDKWKQPDYNDIFNKLNQGVEVSRSEFEALKKEVQEMKVLLAKAAKYDEDNKQPHCETDAKVATLKKVAELLGVDLSEIFKK